MKIGLSTNGKKADKAFFENCRRAGIDCVELSLAAEAYETIDIPYYANLAAEAGVELWSIHLPFSQNIDISTTDEDRRQQVVSYQASLIARAGQAGIRHFVIHPSSEPIVFEERRDHANQAKRSLKTLAEAAEQAGGTLLVEDLPRTCLGRSSFELLNLLKADSRLRVVFDTNHLLGEEIADFIAKVGPYIESLHVSDYDGWNERHWLPGEGCIDWQQLYTALCKVNYHGPWLYEVRFTPESSILRDRDLTAEDFVRNAREVFENKPLTVPGQPVEPMKFWV